MCRCWQARQLKALELALIRDGKALGALAAEKSAAVEGVVACASAVYLVTRGVVWLWTLTLTVDVCGLSLTWLAGRCHNPVPEEDYDRCVLLSHDQ